MQLPSSQRVPISFLILAAALAASASLSAQVAPAAGAKTATTPAAPKEETITLNTFQVNADADDTYDATNTNSVTGTNTPLSKTPLDAKVFNRQLMDELGIVDATEMLAKFGGLGPAIIGSGNEDVRGNLEGDRQDPKSMSMRGLQINNPRRDGFLRSDTTLLDSFDIERVEAIGGSNSLLFGSGDAGGVVTSNSKRAYLNRRSLILNATADSEGSLRYTVDANAGNRLFAVRLNAVKGDTKYFRPNISQATEGLHVTATLRPWKWLEVRGEYRDYRRDSILAQAVIVRAPLTLLLPTGERVDNQNSRYLAAFPESRNLTDGKFDLTTVDSAIGPYRRDAYFNELKSVVAEATLAPGLAVQLRYGHDARVNQSLNPSSTSVFAPGATGNLYTDPATGAIGTKWAMNQTLNDAPFWTGARGYRGSVVYQKNLGRWGAHQASAFYQDMFSWVNSEAWRFYETDSSGKIIQDPARITNTDSGRNVMPSVWVEAFPKNLFGNISWFADSLVHPNGKTYKLSPMVYPYAVPKTAGNPLGLSGPINATTGQTSVSTGVYGYDDTRETSYGFSAFSSWWKERIDTMVGYRSEEAVAKRVQTGLLRGPITYDSLTTGAVFDTGIKGLRGSVNYSTNAKINFDTTRDIYNQPLPPGKGTSKDIGLKFGLFDNRISGNFNYYISEALNFTAGLPNRNDVDPDGINGRNGGGSYVFDKTSDGYNVTLSSRPLKSWEVRINLATANGSERTDVVLPQFYNDKFNTTNVGGQTVVGVRAAAGAAIVPLLVPADPSDPASAQIPLSLAMLRNPSSQYFATLDPESGQILNAETLGLRTAGVGTNETGLPITEHQLGFVSPSAGTIIVKKAGEKTVNYAERSYSLVNRYQFSEGRLNGLVVGLSSSLRQNHRVYMFNDAADGGKRKLFYFPNRLLHDFYAVYRFSPTRRLRASVQLNIANLLDANEVLYLRNGSNGTLRYAQWFNAPRKYSLTTSVSY